MAKPKSTIDAIKAAIKVQAQVTKRATADLNKSFKDAMSKAAKQSAAITANIASKVTKSVKDHTTKEADRVISHVSKEADRINDHTTKETNRMISALTATDALQVVIMIAFTLIMGALAYLYANSQVAAQAGIYVKEVNGAIVTNNATFIGTIVLGAIVGFALGVVIASFCPKKKG